MIKLILVLILISSLIVIPGCTNQNNENICELNKEYQHTAINPINCSCPEGYEFKTTSMGWGPCPNENMTDCPKSILTCVKS